MERVTPQQPEAGSTPEQRPPTVLVVDDDARVVELLQITLGGRGYRVLTAHDGEEALETVRASCPDFVVLDVRIPRRSGFEVCETLRNEPGTKTLPIILISGNAATESRLQGLRAGADDYLTKPFSPRELLLKMQRILERNRDRDVLAMKAEVLEEEVRHQRDKLREVRADFQSHLNRLGDDPREDRGAQSPRVAGGCPESLRVDRRRHPRLRGGRPPRAGGWEARAVRPPRPPPEGSRRRSEFDPGAATVRILADNARAYATDDLALRPECGREVGLLSAAGLLWSIGVQVEGEFRAILCVGDRTDRQPLDRFDIKLLEALGDERRHIARQRRGARSHAIRLPGHDHHPFSAPSRRAIPG